MDDDPRLSSLIFIFILLLLAALFALTETAFSAANKTKIKTYADRGDSRALKALRVLEDFDKAITTLLICTNIVHICAATLVTVFVTNIWGLSAVAIGTFITTIVVFFAGEMLPKSIAKKSPEKFALSLAGLLLFLMKIFTPLSGILSKIGKAAANKIKGDPEISVTEDELYDIIEDMAQEGSIDDEQQDLLSSVLQFTDIRVSSILTKRNDITAIDANLSSEEIFNLVKSTNHSRLPVYSGSIDNITGMLQIRKYLKEYLNAKVYPDVRSLMDKVYFASPLATADDLLDAMTAHKLNMAVIRGEKGRTLGIVTVEDILEEIVGDVFDENDEGGDKL